LSPSDEATHVRHPLRQHFGGWEVRTQHAVFDPNVATLMDFDTDQLDATAFFYVQLRDHLERLGAGEVSIERTEYGVIPMDDRPRGQQWGTHVWNLGTVGAMAKPTSGYTFQEIHAQTRHLIDHWAAGTTPTPLPRPASRYRFADRTLLNILHHHPEHGRPIFERLFRTTPIDDVLTFLDEGSTLGDDARMVARLPWAPFLRAGAAEFGADLVTAISGRR
jgi:lycopene beta-cyclase